MEKNRSSNPIEINFTTLLLGALLGIVMTAANVYLGLYAGMTVSASIPAAVIAAGLFKIFPAKDSLYKSNIIQTMASAGESLAAGVIFTVPALVLIGAWKNFEFWPTTIIAISGGLLGVIFMIPLRKALIIKKSKELTYPEGVACAKVLQNTVAGSKEKGAESLKRLIIGLSLGGLFKFLTSGLKLLTGSVEKATTVNNHVFFFGCEISPALVGVGYIIKLPVAVLVFLGGVIGWVITIPMMGLSGSLLEMSSLDAALTLWSTKVRYIGVGAMLVGGIASLINVRGGIADGLSELKSSYTNRNSTNQSRTEQDMSLMGMALILGVCFMAVFWLYQSLLQNFGFSLLTTVIMIVSAFPFAAVASYIVGLVGSSNTPVSGITIATLLMVAALLLALGYEGDSAILATLGVASVVCCAACTANDCSQDLKTGALIGATPKYQQWAQCIGVITPAFVIAPTLSLLHNAYGIGEGLKAPQATLFASLTQGVFGKAALPYDMMALGVALAFTFLTLDFIFERCGSRLRAPIMPIAIGIYLPLGLSVPMVLGGLIHYLSTRGSHSEDSGDNGILLSSGLIAGEALIGVFLAIIISMNWNLAWSPFSQQTTEGLSLLAFAAFLFYLFKKSKDS